MAIDTDPASAVPNLVDSLPVPPEILALGEPNHGEPALPTARNRVLAVLAGHGFRSVALETDRVAALAVDRWVRGGDGDLDTVVAAGFSHGFGDLPANRELVAWLRAYNDTRPPAGQLSFHGFDAPLEATSAPSPRPYLGARPRLPGRAPR